MPMNLELIMSKYIDVLLNEQLDQSKTKLVIKNGSAKVVHRNKVLGCIMVNKNKAVFQYEIS